MISLENSAKGLGRITTSSVKSLPEDGGGGGGTLPNYFFEAFLALNPKPDKEIYNNKNYRRISLMNIDVKTT